MTNRRQINERQMSLFDSICKKKTICFFDEPLAYLIRCIRKYPLIVLFGENPNICLIRTFSSDEPEKAKRCAWINRYRSENLLKDNGYSCTRCLHTTIEQGFMIGKIFHKPERF